MSVARQGLAVSGAPTLAPAPWDVHRAELYDTIQAQKQRELRHCIYCGAMTRALSRICCAHSDLRDLDQALADRIDEARTTT